MSFGSRTARPVTPERTVRAAAAHGGVAVLLEQGRRLERKGLEPRIGGAARKRRQDHGGKQRNDRDHADDFQQGETGLRVVSATC